MPVVLRCAAMATLNQDPLELATHLPSALIYLRAARHKSLDDVSDATGVTKTMLARMEHGHVNNLEAVRAVTRWLAAGDAEMRAVK